MRQVLDFAVSVYRRANDNQIRGKFSQKLPASTTRHDRFNRVRNHSDRDKLPFSRRDCATDRNSLGANRQPVGDIFDVAAGENGAGFTLDSRSNGEFGIRRVGLQPRF
jgi:hypothetical protein